MSVSKTAAKKPPGVAPPREPQTTTGKAMKLTTEAIHVHVHHYGIENHARSFNEGYEAAMAQHLAPDIDTATEWLEDQKIKARDEALGRVLALADAYAPSEDQDAVISPSQVRQAVAAVWTEAWRDMQAAAWDEGGRAAVGRHDTGYPIINPYRPTP